MSIINNLLSPIPITFLVIIIGYYIGRIKVSKISLDLSAVLIVAVFVGWLLEAVSYYQPVINISEYQTYMKFFSVFGTALFVSSIGISTGSTLDFRKTNDIKAMFIGSLMVITSFVTMHIIYYTDENMTISKLVGTLCGALTTTPGLSTACEFKNIIAEEATLGYGCTYLFGAIATMLFVQIVTRKSDGFIKEQNEIISGIVNKASLGGMIQIGITVILGRLMGSIEILNFSLGNSGGMLFAGIIIGSIIKKYLADKSMRTEEMTQFRGLGLVLFFVGNGIPAGMQIFDGFDSKLILYGALMTVVPIFIGAVIYKLFLIRDRPQV